MTCECKSCKYDAVIVALADRQKTDEDKKMVLDLLYTYLHRAEDAAIWEAKAYGEWPHWEHNHAPVFDNSPKEKA